MRRATAELIAICGDLFWTLAGIAMTAVAWFRHDAVMAIVGVGLVIERRFSPIDRELKRWRQL